MLPLAGVSGWTTRVYSLRTSPYVVRCGGRNHPKMTRDLALMRDAPEDLEDAEQHGTRESVPSLPPVNPELSLPIRQRCRVKPPRRAHAARGRKRSAARIVELRAGKEAIGSTVDAPGDQRLAN